MESFQEICNHKKRKNQKYRSNNFTPVKEAWQTRLKTVLISRNSQLKEVKAICGSAVFSLILFPSGPAFNSNYCNKRDEVRPCRCLSSQPSVHCPSQCTSVTVSLSSLSLDMSDCTEGHLIERCTEISPEKRQARERTVWPGDVLLGSLVKSSEILLQSL